MEFVPAVVRFQDLGVSYWSYRPCDNCGDARPGNRSEFLVIELCENGEEVIKDVEAYCDQCTRGWNIAKLYIIPEEARRPLPASAILYSDRLKQAMGR